MIIRELKSGCGTATVTLDYREIVDIERALADEKEKKSYLGDLARQFAVLHNLTKEGAVELLKPTWWKDRDEESKDTDNKEDK